MAICELKYRSAALGKAIAANIILPESDHPGPFPVLYLLHGLSDDHTQWMRQTSIERYVQGLPLIVVMPDTGRGFYIDMAHGPSWETSIATDLVNYVDKIFPTKAERTGRCLAGLSMGGYGAIKLALRFPDKFCAAVSHSGALHFGSTPFEEFDQDRIKEVRIGLGETAVGGINDPRELAANVPVASRPAIRFDCGTEDFLIEQNRGYHAYLNEIEYPHEYEEFPGEHNWAYWDAHIQEALQFLMPHVGIETN